MFKYLVGARKNPMNKTVKFYAVADKCTPVDMDTIVERIEKRCTVSSADAKAVLDALQYEIKEAVINNGSVRLGDLGTFRATISCKGAQSRDAVGAKNIQHLRLRFNPSVKLKNWLSPDSNPQLKFQKAGDVFTDLGSIEEE